MSGLFNLVPFAVVISSVVGSPHCVGMCGGFALSRSKTVREQTLYHLGRLLGYGALGALAGAFGEKIFGGAVSVWASRIASGAMAATFLALAVRAWRGQTPHFSVVPKTWLGRAFGKADSFGLGFLTAALPCGWLQTFVLSAVATRSALAGAIFLACFWVGTLPALTALPFLARRTFRSRMNTRLSAALLIVAGVGSLAIRAHFVPFQLPPHADEPAMSCHRH